MQDTTTEAPSVSPKTHTSFNRKSLIFIILLILAIAAISAYLFLSYSSVKADTVIFGNIYTGTNGATLTEATAIKDGKFIYAGDARGVQKYINNDTKILNYPDGMVMSGISDTHTHVTMDFQTARNQISLSGYSSVDDYVSAIKHFIEEHPDTEIVAGIGWEYEAFENGIPTKDILDKIDTDKPIYLRSTDAHSAWVNSIMFDKMGITKDTPDPVGGEIKRDENGEPSGMIKETAISLYAKPLMPVYSVDDYKTIILESQKYYASLGYTAYLEIFSDTTTANHNIYQAYEELDKEGKLLLHTEGAWTIANSNHAIDDVKEAIALRDAAKGGMFELTDLKFFMDGVAESHGAFFSEPYTDDPENYGLDRWPGEESFNTLVDCVAVGLENNMVPHFHAIGDAAVTRALDAIAAAREKQPERNNVHAVMTHLEIIKDTDLPRFNELNVIAAANLLWGNRVSDEHYDMEAKRIGEERANNAYPYKTLKDAGATLSFATDYPPGSSALPFGGYSIGISRTILGIKDLERNTKEQLTREEALQALTLSGAKQMQQADTRGTIEVGKDADFIIIDENLITCLPGKAALTIVLKTFVNGQEIYDYFTE